MFWYLVLIPVLVAANGFFVAAEFALVKVRLSEIEVPAREGSRLAQVTERIIGRLDTYLSACQLGVTLASLGLGWVGEPLVARMLEPLVTIFGMPQDRLHFIAFPLAFAMITFLHITAGEQVPKMMAIQKGRTTALAVGMPLAVFYRVFQPFIWLLNTSSNILLRGIGISLASKRDEAITEIELRLTLINAAAGGYVTRRERLIMENVLDMEDKPARRYMLARHQIVFLNCHAPMDEKLRIISETGHTRFPLCDEDMDHIIGIVHVKDIFKAMLAKDELTSLINIARTPLFLPETIKLDVLLLEFQRRQAVLAILVDEYGVASGMITLENVIEELVGPIQDEFDNEPPPIVMKGAHRFEVEASCPVDLAQKSMQLLLPEDTTADTIGGVIIEVLGHIPEEREHVMVGRHRITVLDAEPTRITRVLVERVQEAETEPGNEEEAGEEA